MRLGRYTLKRRIGAGGMAEVWLAVAHGPAGFEKDVAIKRVLPHLAADTEFIRMFIDEAKLVARLVHPNIVQVFDFGTAADDDATPSAPPEYFLAMEFVSGADLASVLRRLKDRASRMPLPLALFVAAEIAKALDYAHGASSRTGEPLEVVHRDISPHNVLVSFGGEVKVADFGIASRAITKNSGSVMRGKISYLSPEQARFEKVDRRSDLFSLGLVFYELITGKRLFTGAAAEEVLGSIARFEGLTEADLADIPAHVRSIVDASLRARRDERYPDAAGMEASLAFAIGSGGAVAARNALAVLVQELFSDEREEWRRAFDVDRPSAEKSITVMRHWDDVDATKTRVTALEPEMAPETDPPKKSKRKRRSRVLQTSGALIVKQGPAGLEMTPSGDIPSDTAISVLREDDAISINVDISTVSTEADPSRTAVGAVKIGEPSHTALSIPRPDADPSHTAVSAAKEAEAAVVIEGESPKTDAPATPRGGTAKQKKAIEFANEVFAAKPRRGQRARLFAAAFVVTLVGMFLGTRLFDGTYNVTPVEPTGVVSELTLTSPPEVDVSEGSDPIETEPLSLTVSPEEAVAVWSASLPSEAAVAFGPPGPLPEATATPTQAKKKATPKKTKKAVTAVASAKGTGWITVLADPWVEVWVDGKRIAEETPLRRKSLRAGAHKLRVVNASIGFDRTTTVKVTEGSELRVFVDVAGKRLDIGS